MEKLAILTSVIALSSVFSLSVLSKSLSYDSLSVSYVKIDLDDNSSPTGYAFSGTKLLNDNVFVGGSYSSISEDVDVCVWSCVEVEVTADQLQLGIGYRHSLSDTTDVYGVVSYIDLEAEASARGQSSSEGANGHAIGVGARAMLTEKLEVDVGVSTANVDDESQNSLGFGFLYYVHENVSLGASYSSSEESNTYDVTLRYSF